MCRHFSGIFLEYKCRLDRVHRKWRTHYNFYFTVSIGSPRLDFDECRRSQSHHRYLDHLGARYYLGHLSIQLPKHLVLLGMSGRDLQRPQ